MKPVKIAFVSHSPILGAGLSSIIARLKLRDLSILPIPPENCTETIGHARPSVVIIDPLSVDASRIIALKNSEDYSFKTIALYHSAMPQILSSCYDATISIYDSEKHIENTILHCIESNEDNDESKTLSQREKDVVIGVVKGLSNKEIAAEMGVSVNTVMTHRRNISSKLEIHSPAGLTIYAIVSKLVSLEDVKSGIKI